MAKQNPRPEEIEEAFEEAPRPTVAKERRCLRCQESFTSAWHGERICPKCKSSHSWRSGTLPVRMGDT
ncbi:MAG: hypothetical protein U1F33_14775 [Alphaproteobacteria bacterium]